MPALEAPASIKYLLLGKAIHRSMEERYSQLSPLDQTAIVNFFTTGDHTSFGTTNQAVLPAIQHWLHIEPTLRDRIFEQPGHLLSTSFAPLLIWALNQPWAAEVRVSVVLRKWIALATDGISPAAGALSASVFAKTLSNAIDGVPTNCLFRLTAPAYDAIDYVASLTAQPRGQSTGLTNNKDAGPATDIAIGLGHLAVLAPAQCGRDDIPLQTLWEQRLTPMWAAMSYSQNIKSICKVLDSDLPDTQKWRALSYTSRSHWENGEIAHKMSQLELPASEYDYALVLPWTDYPEAGFGEATLHAKATSDNKALMRQYCPSLEKNVALLATESDWANAAQMKAWIQLAKPRLYDETLQLPANYSAL